jgi:hypothetical protein
MSYLQQGQILLTPGGGNWKLKLREGQPVPIRLRGRDVQARPELISDLDEVERLLAVVTAANPGLRAFAGIPKGPDGRLDRTQLQAVCGSASGSFAGGSMNRLRAFDEKAAP